MTIKITYFITSLNFGGAEIGMTRLVSGLKSIDISKKFEITVISLAETPRDVVELLPESVEVRHLDMGSVVELWKMRPLWKELSDTDILICSLFHATVLGVAVGKLQRVPNIFTWQHNSEYRNRLASLLYGICYRLSDHVLADSQAVRQMLVSERKVPAKKIAVLPIVGVDTTQFRQRNDEISFANDRPVQIGTVGRLVHQKGYDYLLETAVQLEEKAHFHVIGNGDLRLELENTIERNGINNVTLHGKVPYEELAQFLSSFDIYFQPSRYEGLCMTVIEAMSIGLPVVASETGGIQESVVGGETGFLVPPGKIECYVKRISELIENEDKRSHFGERGRERVIDSYSQTALVENFLELVE